MEETMVDRKGLGRIGKVYAAITAAVVLTGILVVSGHRDRVAGTDTPFTAIASLGRVAR
jgi:hypothetical protein